MKTPERWRALPRRALFVSILGEKLSKDVKTSRRDVTWRHDVLLWRHMTSDVMTKWLCAIYIGHTVKISRKITFFKMATLTHDLWPWPLNLSEILSKAMFLPNFRPVAQTVQAWERWQTDTHTHTQTDGTDFIPSTANAGGKNKMKLKNLLLKLLYFLIRWTSA